MFDQLAAAAMAASMCYPLGEFMTGPSDVLLGYLDVEGGPMRPEG